VHLARAVTQAMVLRGVAEINLRAFTKMQKDAMNVNWTYIVLALTPSAHLSQLLLLSKGLVIVMVEGQEQIVQNCLKDLVRG